MAQRLKQFSIVIAGLCFCTVIWWFLPFDDGFLSSEDTLSLVSLRLVPDTPSEQESARYYEESENATVIERQESEMVESVSVETEASSAKQQVKQSSTESEKENKKKESEETKLRSFKLHYDDEVKSSADKICSKCSKSECKSKCSFFTQLLDHLTSNEIKDEDRLSLHLIPLDPIVWKVEQSYNEKDANKSIEKLARSFDRSSSYLRFKGSDHIFICLAEGCSTFAKKFAEHLSNNKGTRAILAGVNMDWAGIKWPCPLRVIKLTSNESTSTDHLLNKILTSAEDLLYKEHRWKCADKSHPVNHWDKLEEGRFASIYYLNEFNFGLCVFPKGGSTTFKMLMKRLMHRDDWNLSHHVHSPTKNGLKTTNTDKSFELTKKYFEDPKFIKGAIVRNPASRLISGYLDKVVGKSWYHVVPGLKDLVKKQKKPPAFGQFVELLTKPGRDPHSGDKHFRSQTSFCGLDSTKFDFVGDLDHLHEEFIEFADSVGVWEEYGASGWGKNGTDPMVDAWMYRQASHHSSEKIKKFYTPYLLKKVYNYYKADFDILDYSLEELMDTLSTN